MLTLYTLTSNLHSEAACEVKEEKFIRDIEERLGEKFDIRGERYECYGDTDENLIYVRTGGTEGIFKSIFCKDGKLQVPGNEPVRLLTSGKSNSLAASMEILSFLNRNGYPGEIIHGNTEEIVGKLEAGFTRGNKSHVRKYELGRILEGMKVGVVGKPSDWLISSDVDYDEAKKRLGAEIIDIDINKLVDLAKAPDRTLLKELDLNALNKPKFGREITEKDFGKALDIYCALKTIVNEYGLDGISLRCFDLLTALGNTGCLALAILNSQGVVATCEGDVPSLLSMCIANKNMAIQDSRPTSHALTGTNCCSRIAPCR